MHPDQRLLRAILARRAGAEAEFVGRYRRLTVGLAIRRFDLSEAQGEEVFQDLVLRLWSDDFRALRAWRGEGRLSSYLAVIVSRLCLERLRAARRSVTRDEDDLEAALDVGAGPEAGDRLLCEERAAAVRTALAELPDAHRLALMLRFEDERSSEDVGRLLGIRAGAARKRVHDAKRKLRQVLESRFAELFGDGVASPMGMAGPGLRPSGVGADAPESRSGRVGKREASDDS